MHHINQTLVVDIISFAGGLLAIIPLLGSAISGIISLAVLPFNILGAIRAATWSIEPLPFIYRRDPYHRIRQMDREELAEYLNTRRLDWPYENSYHIAAMPEHRFVARAGDEIAGLSYAVISDDGSEAVMKMNIKSEYAEYGIGTELLSLLMDDLQKSGIDMIRYSIPLEYYAFQIYKNLGFEIENRDEETIRFVKKRV